ncbi:MAG TPA: histidine kinase [Ktedonosporobacter sp.]|jgi:NarL family two-component system sensor histidine kinase LiaS|nr:histidine kinase [Ktedonosporobacter sp.]
MMRRRLKGLGLQARMTISYVWVTIASVLLLEIVAFFLILLTVRAYYENNLLLPRVQQTAQQYASAIAAQSKGASLNPATTYALGTPGARATTLTIEPGKGVVIPAITGRYPDNEPIAFALLVAPNGKVIASSYPQRYHKGAQAAQLVPDQTSLINNALQGKQDDRTKLSQLIAAGNTEEVAATVWGKNHLPIGAVYVQIPITSFDAQLLMSFSITFLISGFLLLLVTAPIGGIFGVITTRGLVRRLNNLVSATTKFANGDYSQRVRIKRADEVGQLEEQFNRMAQQLVESISRRQELAEQNARLAERSRISRELHDAISQELFSLNMLAGGIQAALPADSALQPQVAMLEQTTTNVIREMRALLLELRPNRLEELGLAEALEEIATAYSTRLGVTVTTNIAKLPLNAKAEHTLLRITQEAITNAVRHANASMIEISLLPHGQTIELKISDSGKGFDPRDNAGQHGLGLRQMQERVQELNGQFILQTHIGKGTQIQVYLPGEQACDSRNYCG